MKHIKRERLVKKEEKPKQTEEVKSAPKSEAKVGVTAKQPEAVPMAGLKESLNFGKGGFAEILDEMHNLSLPPPDSDHKSAWGGASQKSAPKQKPSPAADPQVVRKSSNKYQEKPDMSQDQPKPDQLPQRISYEEKSEPTQMRFYSGAEPTYPHFLKLK